MSSSVLDANAYEPQHVPAHGVSLTSGNGAARGQISCETQSKSPRHGSSHQLLAAYLNANDGMPSAITSTRCKTRDGAGRATVPSFEQEVAVLVDTPVDEQPGDRLPRAPAPFGM